MKLQLVIEDVKELDCDYKLNLFKMQNLLSFEKFEELFDEEDEELPNEPLFENEWRTCEDFYLHTNQAGVFVVVIDTMQFMNCKIQKLKFLVSYEIKSENKTAELTMNAGKIEVDASTIYGSESEIGSGKLEIYKDLLAVTSVATMVEMNVKFEKIPKAKFQEFMTTTLKFANLSEDNVDATVDMIAYQSNFDASEMMEIDFECPKSKPRDSFFFYSNDNYFKGMLVRLKVVDPKHIKMKVYLRFNHQIVTFAKAIHQKFTERCAIDVKKGNETNLGRNLIEQTNADDVS